jgi:hypothetical protein
MTSMKIFIPIALVVAAIDRVAQVLLPRMGPSGARVILGSVVVVIFAGLLFLLKLQQPIFYGSLEALFAVWSCAFSLSRVGDTLSATVLIGLFTSIYLMIRSADNVNKGVDQWRAKRRGILATTKKLSKPETVSKYRVWFAAIVRATGELFLVQTQSIGDKHLILLKPPIDRNSRYTGILFADGDAEEIWKKPTPRTEQQTFVGCELKMVEGSFKLFLNRDPRKIVPTAPPPAPSTPV